MKSIKQYMKKDEEEGFTLIELLVVVLILGILMAIAIPTFLSLTGGAKTSAAEADLTTAAQDEAAFLTTNGVFDTVSGDVAGTGATGTWSAGNVASMKAADAGLNWVNANPGAAGTKSVSVYVSANSTSAPLLYLETAGSDGNYYWVKDAAGTLTYSETSAILAYGTPAATFTATSWKALPSTVPAS
jgi:prepilin-type N-terminal cleavage/methylation domain-containing protein